jgi:hypothetical protein
MKLFVHTYQCVVGPFLLLSFFCASGVLGCQTVWSTVTEKKQYVAYLDFFYLVVFPCEHMTGTVLKGSRQQGKHIQQTYATKLKNDISKSYAQAYKNGFCSLHFVLKMFSQAREHKSNVW